MAKNPRRSEFVIELNIEKTDATIKAVDQIERSLKSISDTAKSDELAKGLESANTQAKALADKMNELASSEEDSTKEIEAYGRAATRAVQQLEKQYALINYSLSEQGKEQRARIAELSTELTKLGDTKEERAKAKELEKEISKLKKDVLNFTDEELEKALELNSATRATLTISQKEAKLRQAEVKSHKTLGQLVKADLKAVNEKIKAQFKFIDALKTTEGRYNLIKKAAEKAGKASLQIAKVAGGAVIGGALALGGAAIASAGAQVDREREVNRIKGSLSTDEKSQVLGEVYAATGADISTIVDAINRVHSVLGNAKSEDVIEAATAEVKMPGMAALFRQQNTGAVGSKDFTALFNRRRAMQSLTGASTEQMAQSSDYIANLRQSSFSNASQADLETLYLALQNSGAFDSDEELQRAFRSFVRTQKTSNLDVFELAKKWQENGQWARTAYGATNKTQVLNSIGNLDFGSMATQSRITDYSKPAETDAEMTARKLRELEETKNRILVKVLSAIAPVLEKIDATELEKMFDAALKFFEKVTPPLMDFISKALTFITKLLDDNPNGLQGQGVVEKDLGNGMVQMQTFTGPMRANGGLAAVPSIVGEAGPEMVVPLDPSRQARGRELTQNLTQYFNLSGSETTTLSLSQAVKSRDFTTAVNHNAYISRRLGR